RPNKSAPTRLKCECGVTNILERIPEYPNIPRSLYIGHDRLNQMKVYPVPPDTPRWAQPYSIRSFVAQASKRFAGCTYSTRMNGFVMDEPVFTDRCADFEDAFGVEGPCHLLAGFSIGQPTCKLWESISGLCQTDIEKKFLFWFLGLAKDRQFPMLIP